MATPPPIRLYLSEERSNGYYHLTARVVIDGSEGVRNAEWTRGGYRESSEGIYVADLEVRSQGGPERRRDDGSPNLYGWEVEFKPFVVDERRAKRMTETFKILDRKLRKLDEQFGRPLTYGQYLGRIALALGAEGFIVPKDRPAAFYTEMEYRRFTIQDGIAHADHLVRQWAEAA